jgi:hypothetical protein
MPMISPSMTTLQRTPSQGRQTMLLALSLSLSSLFCFALRKQKTTTFFTTLVIRAISTAKRIKLDIFLSHACALVTVFNKQRILCHSCGALTEVLLICMKTVRTVSVVAWR